MLDKLTLDFFSVDYYFVKNAFFRFFFFICDLCGVKYG